MNSTGHKPRGWTEEELDFDHMLRLQVRRLLKLLLPDLDRPPGGGWVYCLSEYAHIRCGRLAFQVSVPRIDLPGLHYCPDCRKAFVALDVGDDAQ